VLLVHIVVVLSSLYFNHFDSFVNFLPDSLPLAYKRLGKLEQALADYNQAISLEKTNAD
jgi:tetratricopeptide (TPR) repeat protein